DLCVQPGNIVRYMVILEARNCYHPPNRGGGRVGVSACSAAGMQCRKSLRLSCRDQPQTEGSQVRMPFENRTAQTRTATTMEPTIASHSVYGAVSGISFPSDSRIAPSLRP